MLKNNLKRLLIGQMFNTISCLSYRNKARPLLSNLQLIKHYNGDKVR